MRLFVALVPPAPVQAGLAALAAPLAGARWTPAENLHLTLRFIGEAAPEKQDAFIAALARVRVEPFVLPTGGVGLFPSRGPAKVLWAGVGRGHTRLYQLRKQVDEALLTVDSGLAMPGFHPPFHRRPAGRSPRPQGGRPFPGAAQGVRGPAVPRGGISPHGQRTPARIAARLPGGAHFPALRGCLLRLAN